MEFVSNFEIILLLYYAAVIVHGSVKKGISINPNNFLCDDLKVLDNVVWWYDWAPNLDNLRRKSGCLNVDQHAENHVPMAWGYGSYFQNYYLLDAADFLLGFNEPNHKAQSNILAEDAARYWPEVERLAAGRPLVSPAAAPCGSNCNGDTKEWFDLFFKSCNGCRVDYLATHVYLCNADQTMEFLEDLYKTYNRTIWLTEFACPYKTDPKRQLRYMQELLPRLEKAEFIIRYAWFVSRVTEMSHTRFIPTSVSLFEPDSSNLTALGQFYNSFTSTETTSVRTTLMTTQKNTTATTTTSKSVTSSTTPSTITVTTTGGTHSNTTTIYISSTTQRKDYTTEDGSIISEAIKVSSISPILFLSTLVHIYNLL